jgi:RNA polymerase sigma factor for flagellar operon FliA
MMIERSARPSVGQVKEWWKQFGLTGDPAVRERLVRTYVYVVYKVANALRTHLPDRIDTDELVSAGFLGLIQAFDGYDPSRPVKFQTYCAHRVRGAMLDHLRASDWMPRSARRQVRDLSDAARGLQNELGRTPADEEIAQRMNLPALEVHRLRAASPAMTSMGSECGDSDTDTECQGSLHLSDALDDKKGQSPPDAAQRSEVRHFVAHDLSRTERLLILLYYYEGMTMQEVGRALGVSESRVCQVHARILRQLRAAFGEPTALPARRGDREAKSA